MIELIFVGIGGAFGSLFRFHLGNWVNQKYAKHSSLGTLIINVSGAFLLGVVVTMGSSHSYQLLFADGFLGAYTTFSTFMYETFTLTQDGAHHHAFRYIIGSVVFGVLGFGLGVYLVNYLI